MPGSFASSVRNRSLICDTRFLSVVSILQHYSRHQEIGETIAVTAISRYSPISSLASIEQASPVNHALPARCTSPIGGRSAIMS